MSKLSLLNVFALAQVLSCSSNAFADSFTISPNKYVVTRLQGEFLKQIDLMKGGLVTRSFKIQGLAQSPAQIENTANDVLTLQYIAQITNTSITVKSTDAVEIQKAAREAEEKFKKSKFSNDYVNYLITEARELRKSCAGQTATTPPSAEATSKIKAVR